MRARQEQARIEREKAFQQYLERRKARHQKRQEMFRAAMGLEPEKPAEAASIATPPAMATATAEEVEFKSTDATMNETETATEADNSDSILDRVAELMLADEQAQPTSGVAGAFANASTILQSAFQAASSQVESAVQTRVNATTDAFTLNLLTMGVSSVDELESRVAEIENALASAESGATADNITVAGVLMRQGAAQMGVLREALTELEGRLEEQRKVMAFEGPAESPTPAATDNPIPSTAAKDGLGGGAIAGIVVVAIVVVIAAAIAGTVYHRRNKRRLDATTRDAIPRVPTVVV